MLSIPKHGWVDISVDNWTDRASYLSDVPNDILDALIQHFKTSKPTIASFDAEGWDYYIIFTAYNTFIIESKDNFDFISTDVPSEQIAKEIIKDISEHIDEWAQWNFDATTPAVIKKEREILEKKIDKLKELLEGKH